MKWFRELISAHFYPDPLLTVLCDLVVLLAVLYGVLLIRYQAAHGGRYPWQH